MTQVEKVQERQRLGNLIQQWNQEHYDLFEIALPNEDLEFHGVVRFYFQDDDHNVVTKCIRVASSAKTREVVDVLVDKFRPDMALLSNNKYNLYEVHINGDERRLMDEERPLFVQLNWGKDVREGRFLLKREGAQTIRMDKEGNFKRRLSKREKKEKKKLDKEKKMNKENVDKNASVTEQLYNDMPETSFTRTISNPEMVMKRRRQQKLEKKLQQFHGQNGQGGTLKIYGETLKPDIPYKTLLLSTADTVSHVIKEAVEKYGMEGQDLQQFELVQVLVPPGEREYHGGTIGEERVLEEDECPLSIAMQHPPSRGMLMFQLKRKNADAIRPKNKRPRAVSHDDLRYGHEKQQQSQSVPPNKLPFLVELNADGKENPKGRVHRLHLDVTEVGSERSMSTSGQYLQLYGPGVQPRHCVLAHTNGIVTVTPTHRDTETYVNNTRITETTLLAHGNIVRFGKSNLFRFLDPIFEEKQQKGPLPQDVPDVPNIPQNQQFGGRPPPETSFDMDGRVETVAPPPSQTSRQSSMHEEMQQKSSPREPISRPERQEGPRHIEEALPAALEFREERENEFLGAVILDTNASATQFKLSPTYSLYMAVRFRLSNVYKPEMSPTDRAHKLTSLVNKISNMLHQAIQDNRDNPAALAFWMANASEILHFFKQDHDIYPFSQDAQEMLAEAVQMAFHHLVRCLQYDLQQTLPAFLDENDNIDEDDMDDRMRYNRNKPTLAEVLDTLSSAMNLLRRCRVNAALTIQLFSQLFHFVNMWLFNILVADRMQLCTRAWGMRLKRRLGRVEAWAEKQGLELAADCHLCRIIQAAHLLQAPKSNPDDIANISSTCFKLNSLQLRELLQRYIPEPGEPPIPHNLIDRVVAVAENMADELIRTDGRDVQLEEDPDLQLPFLLPEDGYSCDTIRGVPNGLGEFVEPLTRSGLCRMTIQPQSRGLWTVYMSDDEGPIINEQTLRKERPQPEHRPQPSLPREPEVVTVTFNKVKGSMGLSIVAAKGDGQRERGIYIKSVVPGGAAALDGRLQAGDQLLEVDGKSLVGLTQEKAADLMTKTGQTVSLKVAKQGAIYHGLATLLSQPSPVMQRASPQKGPTTPVTPNKQRPQDEGPPPYNGTPDMLPRQDSRSLPREPVGANKQRGQALRGPDSRSSPALNSADGGGPDRFRAGNLREQPGAPIQPHGQADRRWDNRGEIDKSKSIPNLRMDTSYDGRPDQQQQMRPAASVGALQGNPNHDYYNQVPRPDESKNADYENQPLRQGDRGYPAGNQPSPSSQYARPHADRAPHGQGSFRDERPQSAYFPRQDHADFTQSRPKSEEFTPEKMRDFQERFGEPGQQSPHDRSYDRNMPNYSNIRPQPNYANQGDIRKMDVNNQPRQPNFYENTVPRQQEVPPPFHQLRQPPAEERPSVAPKPAIGPKPNQPVVQPADIPRSDIDNRPTQPHFFDPQKQNMPPYSQGYVPQQQQPSPSSHYQNTSFHDPRSTSSQRSKISPARDHFHGQRAPEMPPPPSEIPPDLPPPPSMEDLHGGDSPPLPPPPINDIRLEQQIREEQSRMMAPIDPQYNRPSDPSYSNLPPQQGYNPSMYGRQMMAQQVAPPMVQAPPEQPSYMDQNRQQSLHPSAHDRFQPNHDYQNINYNRSPNRSFEMQQQQPPVSQAGHGVYESYDPRLQQSQSQVPKVQFDSKGRPVISKLIQDQREAVISPWDRDAKEKAEKQQQSELNRLREHEIAELESRPHIHPHEQERLSKLRLEQEFQRRVQEVSEKDDDDSDSDMPVGRERLLQTVQEDLVKSRLRMQELERKRLFDDYDREKDRMLRLERKLEMFENEKEEQRQRLQKRQEKQQRETEEYLRKQKEAREKQKRDFEEKIRLQKLEEEKMNKRKQEEAERRKEMEKQRLKEIQAAKEAEEAAAREQIRRQEEEFARQRALEEEQKRREQEREIRVMEERKRLEAMSAQNQNQNQYSYQQYANLPPQPSPQVMPGRYMTNHSPQGPANAFIPPPPERGSSYSVANRTGGPVRPEPQVDSKFNGGYHVNMSSSPLRSSQENIPSKKSVSFNTQMQPQRSDEQRSPNTSYPFQSQQNSYPESAFSRTGSNLMPSSPVTSPMSDVNSSLHSPLHNNMQDAHYHTTTNTPNVIGSQEVYRDPRDRMGAKPATQKNPNADRMSFREKMKYFAQEAGENTPKYKPKASKSQRAIESQLQNGQ